MQDIFGRVNLQLGRERDDPIKDLLAQTSVVPPKSYVNPASEKYVFSIRPEGYEQTLRVTIEFPTRNIDKEAALQPKDDVSRCFEREAAAFQALLPTLLQDRPGKFVAVLNAQIVDEDDDEFALAARLERTHRSQFVLVRQISLNTTEDYLESPEVDE